MNKTLKTNLLDMDYDQMCDFFASIGEARFRAEQIMQWIYHNYCDDFDLMTNFDKKLRDKLKLISDITAPNIRHEYHSIDGTIKWSMNVDEQLIETVYIPEKKRATLCISSQIGCLLNCVFCSTGQQGFNRNLRTGEIIGQIWRVAKIMNSSSSSLNSCLPITNIVLMGMGEPLLNLRNVVAAIKIMTDNLGFGLSKRRITISTVGIVPALNKLSDMVDVVLAISLHAPTDHIRNKIIPINKKYNINSILKSVKGYLLKSYASQGYVTIEYVMLNNINDHIDHAYKLINCLRDIPCKINLIPWNYIPNTSYLCSSEKRINIFAKILKKHGLITIIRRLRGHDINAACGQLTGHIFDRIKRINNNKEMIFSQ